MFHKVITRLQQLFRSENETNEIQNEERTMNVSPTQRLEEPKVVYQYPKQGKFRFPVMEDEERVHSFEKVERTDENVLADEPEKEKWFSSEKFERTDVPSPVYGFKRQKERAVMSVHHERDDKKEPLFKEEKIETVNIEVERKIEEPAQSTTEVAAAFEAYDPDPFVTPLVKEREYAQSTGEVPALEEESELVHSVEEVSAPEEELDSAHSTEEIPTQVEELDSAQETVEIVATIEEEIEVNESLEQIEKEELKHEGRRPIPYNVIMLPQDWLRINKLEQRSLPPQRKEVEERNEVAEPYTFPTIDLLNKDETKEETDGEWIEEKSELLEQTLQSFHVDAKVVHKTKGPTVTRFEIQPGRGVKVNKITVLTDDIKLALAAKDIRIEAPIPGKNTIGIEVPNQKPTPVFLREVLQHELFTEATSPLTVALGLDISGKPIITDLKKMPHGLVAGATGSGKSVCINSILVSLLFKATPDEVKLLLIDPKMVELAPYNEIPHLVTPVITDAKQATAALKWTVAEMERRYEQFSQKGAREIGRFNEMFPEEKMPYILVVIDELADLMMVSPQEVEESIARIAQKARACGIHLLLATQRPSVDVITGLIKANIPTRIAFSVSSQTDSRTILDTGGAERLLGRGDMLFHENGTSKPIRLQGTFVSDEEIDDVIIAVKKERQPDYLFAAEQLKQVIVDSESDDEYFEEACYYVVEQGSASASSLQRKFRIGYNRAARMIDLMEEKGIISATMGSKPRQVLIDEIELERLLQQQETIID